MDAYNYNSLISELCSLSNKNLDLNVETSKDVESPKGIETPKNIETPKDVEISKVGGTPKIKSNLQNYTIMEPLQKLVSRSLTMRGGNAKFKYISEIAKFYPRLTSNQIIDVLAALVYTEFTDPDSKKEFKDIITPEYIKNIPVNPPYLENFRDKVMRDLLAKCPNINERFDILDENIELLLNFQQDVENQKGGKKSHKRIDISDDKTVEEKIKNNINTLSTFLKSKNYTKNQKGGAVDSDMMIKEINEFNNLDKSKKNNLIIDEIQEKSNLWVTELLEEKLVTKVIKDDQFNLARFYLQTNSKSDDKIKKIIEFVNEYASILTFSGRKKLDDIPNKIDKVYSYGKSERYGYTDKLKEYFKKKYEELSKIKLGETESKSKSNPSEQIQFVLTEYSKLVQTGGATEEKKLEKKIQETFEDRCFTSRQLEIFLKRVGQFLRESGRVIDESDIKIILTDINKLKEIEKKLIDNYKIFGNYIQIQKVYPDTTGKEITINHMKNVIDNNQGLFTSYGTINTEILDLINKIEKYSDIKVALETQELNKLSQSGGNSFKSHLKFNMNHDVEHFTSDSFKAALDKMKKLEE